MLARVLVTGVGYCVLSVNYPDKDNSSTKEDKARDVRQTVIKENYLLQTHP